MKTAHKIQISILSLFFAWSSMHAASFSSGSDGSDGALTFDEDLGTVVFDPDDFDPALDADRDGVYHFTTITIGGGTRVRLRGDVLGQKPVIWLASGDVFIEGDVDLRPEFRGIPGAGGFPGGNPNGAVDGQGPGGSAASGTSSGDFPTNDHVNNFLMPLLGGAGQGAGAIDDNSSFFGLGGGGAILIASSTQINLNGEIFALGAGDASTSNSASGNVRLVANQIRGFGDISGVNVL